DFIKTGTVHAIAISGLHVGLIAAIFLGALALLRLPKKVNLVLTACALVLYMFIAGSSPPVVRAVIIFVVFVVGYLINRESDMLNSLAFAAFIMLLANPKELFNPSFQLSFASIAGMVIFIPVINVFLRMDAARRRSFFGKAGAYLLSAVSVSAGAWLSTWPIVAHYFNIISPMALVANLVVVPALFVLTAGSFLFLLAVPFSGFLSGSLAHALSVFCKALFTANHFLADLPFAYFRISAPSGVMMVLYYAAIFLIVLPPKMEFKKICVRRIDILIVLLIALNVMVWSDAAAVNRDALKITFLDVGQGDSALLELPGGKNVLIDAGPGGDEERFDAARSVIAPYLWNRKINKLDAVIVTHFHEDHLGGMLYLVDNFKVMSVMDNGATCENSEIFDKYRRAIKNKKINRVTIGDGDAINFNGGKIIVLNPAKGSALADSNENSLVLKIHRKHFDALFCGDASNVALARMTAQYGDFLRSDVIKIPHHGGNVGSDIIVKDFLNTADADAAVISVAKMNKYRHPSKKTLAILNALNTPIYQTKDNGAIMISVDKDSYDIKPYTKNN
ncbi:MAG: DNA internalization-related competence protein ComEC/Rec2, partial [Candidatus Omnitrophica bacterium]|nr:DNA internalization-related competence protein ComEC/Rec2 [Candidatus Omnitrophota bacterium]